MPTQLDTDTMGATERVLATINHEEPDRVPIYLMGMPDYSDFYQEFLRRESDPRLGFEAWTTDDANLKFTPFGDLTMPYFFGQECAHASVDIQGRFKKWIDAEGQFIPQPEDATEKRQVTYYGRLEGVKTLDNGLSYTWYLGGWLDRKEKLVAWFNEYGWPHEHKVRALDLQAYEAFQRDWSDQFCLHLAIGGAGLYEKTWFMMGQARFVYYARRDPAFLLRVINSIKQMQLNLIEEIKRARPAIVWCADDLGQKGRALMSPAFHRKFFGAARREIFAKVHEETDAKIIMHSCGNIVELLPDLVEWGLDGWQSMEPASEVDHAAVKRKFGDRMSFWGAIDTSRVLPFGTTAEICEHVRRQVERLGSGGGYVAGPAHDYLNVPVDNAIAMRDAILEFGSEYYRD